VSDRIVFEAIVDDDGKFKPEGANLVRAKLLRWNGKRVYVTVDREKKPRSLNANAYLWSAVYGAISEWSGYEPDELHELFKRMFLPAKDLAMPTGEILSIPGSTAALDTGAFAVYVSKVKRWAAEQGLYIPEPGEVMEWSA
jgi:hypothetical protein